MQYICQVKAIKWYKPSCADCHGNKSEVWNVSSVEFLKFSIIYQNTLTYADYILFPSGEQRSIISFVIPLSSHQVLPLLWNSMWFPYIPSFEGTGTFNYICKNCQKYSQSAAGRFSILLQIMAVKDFKTQDSHQSIYELSIKTYSKKKLSIKSSLKQYL